MKLQNHTLTLLRTAVCLGLLLARLPEVYAGTDDGKALHPPVRLHFRFDDAVVDSGYMDNSLALVSLDGLLTDSELHARIDSIEIYAFASPDGDRTHNERLARSRAIAVKGYIVWRYPFIDQHSIHLHPEGENWQGLLQSAETDPHLPCREEVLKILRDGKDPERCKALLRKLDGGRPYRYIQDNMLRPLRNAAVCIVWLQRGDSCAAPESSLTVSGIHSASCKGTQQDSLTAEKAAEPHSSLTTEKGGSDSSFSTIGTRPDSTAASADAILSDSERPAVTDETGKAERSAANSCARQVTNTPIKEEMPQGTSRPAAQEGRPDIVPVSAANDLDEPAVSAQALQSDLPAKGQTANPLSATPGREVKESRPIIALKTNMLFDAALMPNVEIEVPIGKRWSVNGEYLFPWWVTKDNRYCLQILSGTLEGKYWFGNPRNRQRRKALTGQFIGLYAGAGEYDLQWKESGYQGEFFIAAGVSYGWVTEIARNLNIEMSIGVGFLRTNYRHYHPIDDYRTLLWQENGKYTWLGPTKAKVSLVWVLNGKVRKGGTR